jgi:hypothetical protein
VLANALLASTLVMVAVLFGLMDVCAYLRPHRWVLLHQYGLAIGTFAAVLFVNLTAGFYGINRVFFLKDTGRKLAHVEKQLRSRSTIVKELSDRLEV